MEHFPCTTKEATISKHKLSASGEYKTKATTTTTGWKPQTQKSINKSKAELGLAGAGLRVTFCLLGCTLAVTMSREVGTKQREKPNPQKALP
jgi:hypothetical protein